MIKFVRTAGVLLAVCATLSTFAANPQLPLLNEPVDVSGDFRDLSDFYYLADQLAEFNPATGSLLILYAQDALTDLASRTGAESSFWNDCRRWRQDAGIQLEWRPGLGLFFWHQSL